MKTLLIHCTKTNHFFYFVDTTLIKAILTNLTLCFFFSLFPFLSLCLFFSLLSLFSLFFNLFLLFFSHFFSVSLSLHNIPVMKKTFVQRTSKGGICSIIVIRSLCGLQPRYLRNSSRNCRRTFIKKFRLAVHENFKLNKNIFLIKVKGEGLINQNINPMQGGLFNSFLSFHLPLWFIVY